MSGFDLQPEYRSAIDAMREQIQLTPMPDARFGSTQLRRCARMPQWLAAFTGGAAAVMAAIVAVVFGAATSPPAYGVTRSGDGLVTISLTDLDGLADLNARLAAMRVRIRAVPVVRGCDSPARAVVGSRVLRARTLTASAATYLVRDGRSTLLPSRLTSETLREPDDPRRTLVVAATRSGLRTAALLVQGAVPSCVGDGGAARPLVLSTR